MTAAFDPNAIRVTLREHYGALARAGASSGIGSGGAAATHGCCALGRS